MEKDNGIIYIIDDEIEVCGALKWLFESVQFKVETYASANNFLELYKPSMRGCLIVDVRLPGMSGLELLDHLKLKKPHLPVIMMSGFADIPMAVRAMKSGAIDFILKPFNEQCLLEAVQKCISQSTNHYSIELIHEHIASLSTREHQVIELILDGKLNKQIAFELSISISTVEAHRANIMRKMKAKNLAQLIKWYLQAQLDIENNQ